MPKSIATLALLLFLTAGFWPSDASAQSKRKVSFIRDAEIENTIRNYAAPLFRAAGLAPDDVCIYLVNDRSLNAFVAGGQQLFIHTGLLMRADNAGQVIGVIAHEAGHIAGGHLSRLQAQVKRSTKASLLGFLLGGAVAIGTGRSDAGAAIIAGSQSVATRQFLGYTRAEESSADQAALRFLDSTAQSSRGLLEFMRILEGQELLAPSRQDPYVRTHPLTRQRINTVAAHLANSPNAANLPSPAFEMAHQRMKAKLHGYLNPASRTLRLYKKDDPSLPARYARAFAFYRKPDLAQATAEIDALLADHPDDPYFHELKAQILFKQARLADSLVAYQRSVDLAPKEPLLLTELARVQIEIGDPALLDAAIANLRKALERERDVAFTWRQLGIAYGKKGDIGRSSLALGEAALLSGDSQAALIHAGKAANAFPRGAPEWLQAQDLRTAAEKQKSKRRQ